jgi:protein SCO1/2
MFLDLLFRAAVLLTLSATLASAQARDGRASSRWGADYFPNVPLVAHDGREVRFFDDLVADKTVVISFIYTSCADACPLETAKLTEVQELLADRLGRDVFFYSISIDPERDTPAVLADYATRFGVGPGWLFLTGAKEDIRLLRQKLGMIGRDEVEFSEHTLSLLIGNQSTGQWMKRSPFESPHLLAAQIGTWLTNWKAAPERGRDYANAPELRSISRGESLYRTRCSACHLLGPDDGIARQGPPLLGVTRQRDGAWLARWIAEPDVMLREKDPLALELFAAYRNISMPNLRLAPGEVEAVLEYMRAEDERLGLPPPVRAAEPPSCCEKESIGLVGDAPTERPQAAVPPTASAQKSHGLLACGLALLLVLMAASTSARG